MPRPQRLFFTSSIDQKIKILKTIDTTLRWEDIVEIIGRTTGKYFSRIGVQMRWKKHILKQKTQERIAKKLSFEWDNESIKQFADFLTSQLNIKSAFKLFVESLSQRKSVQVKQVQQRSNRLITDSIRNLQKMCCECDNQFKFSTMIPRKTLDSLFNLLKSNKKGAKLKSLQNLLAKVIKYEKFGDKITRKQIVAGYKLMIHIIEQNSLHRQAIENQRFNQKIMWSTKQKYKLFQLYQVHRGILAKIVQDLTITGEESASRFKPRNIRDRVISLIGEGLYRLEHFIKEQKDLLPQQNIKLPSKKHLMAINLYGGNLRIGQFSLNQQLIRLNFIQELSKEALIVIIRMIKQMHMIRALPLDLPRFQDFQKQMNIKIEDEDHAVTNKGDTYNLQEEQNDNQDPQFNKGYKQHKNDKRKRRNRNMFKRVTPQQKDKQLSPQVDIFDQQQ